MVRAGLAALCLAGASGCSLILDFDEEPSGPNNPPYTQAECDFGEPNDSAAEATPFTPDDVGPAAICPDEPDDRDNYRFTVPAGTAGVTVRVMFESGMGRDLDLRITDLSGATTYGQSRSFEDVEAIACPGTSPPCPTLGAGDYVFEVFGATAGAVNRYDISLTITPM